MSCTAPARRVATTVLICDLPHAQRTIVVKPSDSLLPSRCGSRLSVFFCHLHLTQEIQGHQQGPARRPCLTAREPGTRYASDNALSRLQWDLDGKKYCVRACVPIVGGRGKTSVANIGCNGKAPTRRARSSLARGSHLEGRTRKRWREQLPPDSATRRSRGEAAGPRHTTFQAVSQQPHTGPRTRPSSRSLFHLL